MHITTGLGASNPAEMTQQQASWSDIKELLTEPVEFPAIPEGMTRRKAKAALALPWFNLTKYEPAYRNASNVKSFSGILLDFDGEGGLDDSQAQEIIDKAQRWTHILYTSSGSKPGAMKLRIVHPFTRDTSPEEYREIWKNLQSHYAQQVDKSTKNLDRLFFTYGCFPGDAENMISIAHDAQPVDADAILAESGATPTSEAKRSAPQKPLLTNAIKSLSMLQTITEAQAGALACLRLVSKGESLNALDGAKNESLYQAARALNMQARKKGSLLDPQQAAELFRASIDKTETDDESADETLAIIADQFTRSEKHLVENEDAAPQQVDGLHYTPEELDALAQEHGIDQEQLDKQWLVRHGGGLYLLGLDGYRGPYSGGHQALASRTLAPVESATVWKFTQTGATLVPASELEFKHGSVADSAIASYVRTKSYYDHKEQTMYEACAPFASIEATYHEDVNTWLQLLGGIDYELLFDWMAHIKTLSEPLGALYLKGAAAVGKSLFVAGIAKLWRSGSYTQLTHALQQFNDSLIHSPLVFADEGLPKIRDITAKMRDLITSRDLKIERKGKPVIRLEGATRVIIAANNYNALKSEGEHTNDDFEAYAQRFTLIECADEAEGYLKSLSTEALDTMRSGRIAEHCQHLIENRQMVRDPASRFIVKTNGAARLKNHLIMNNEETSIVIEWLAGFLRNPTKAHNADNNSGDSKKFDPPSIVFNPDEPEVLYVNSTSVRDNWPLYTDYRQDFTQKQITTALSAIAKGKSKDIRTESGKMKYWPVDVRVLRVAFEHNQTLTGNVTIEAALLDLPTDTKKHATGNKSTEPLDIKNYRV